MKTEQRKRTRYEDIGKIEIPELTVFPGVLEDISQTGCKVRFPVSIDVDMDREYELKFTPTRAGQNSFVLLVLPMWSDNSSNTQVGFQILYSPGEKQLEQYISFIAREENELEIERTIEEACLV